MALIFRKTDSDAITIVAEANRHNGSRLLNGFEALGYLCARGAVTKQLRSYDVLQHHPAFWVIDKIVRNLAKQSTRQRRGLEQRGAAHHDVGLAIEFVNFLVQCGLLSIPKGRKDLVKVTDQGRNVFSRYVGENYFSVELTQFFADRPANYG